MQVDVHYGDLVGFVDEGKQFASVGFEEFWVVFGEQVGDEDEEPAQCEEGDDGVCVVHEETGMTSTQESPLNTINVK